MTQHRYATALAPCARALLLAAGLTLAGASVAYAQVIYTDVEDVTLSATSLNPTVEIDLDGANGPDLLFERQTGAVQGADVLGFGVKPVNSGGGVVGEVRSVYSFNVPFATALPPNNVASGSRVDSAALCLRINFPFGRDVRGDEAWREGGAFLGFTFTLADGVHYGWARLRAGEDCESATLEAFAYEATPGQPILAGNTGAGGLPVELVAFEARVDGDRAVLEWATASETNNAGFEVQHEVGGSFERVGFVEGAGTATEERRYAHEVGGLLPGAHRFRLKQLDHDGTFAFSPEVTVRLEVPGTHLLSAAYPNPFNPRTRFTLSVARRQHVEVAVYDALGRHVARLYEGVLEGGAARVFEVEGRAWPSGVYLIRARGETFAEVQRVTLAK